MAKRISIITTAYNSGKTIRDTLESVLRQTFRDYELIIKDGGSTDDTINICREYEPRFSGRMVLVSEPDQGIYDAMNVGLSLATGDIIGILNSDDYYTTDDILQKVAEALRDPMLDAVYGDVHYVSPHNLHRCIRYYSSERFRPSLMRYGFMPAHPSFYCRKSVYDRYGMFDKSYRIAADFDLLLRFIYFGKIRTKYLPLDFVTMRTGGISTSGLRSHVKVLQEHHTSLKRNGVKSNYFVSACRFLYKLKEFRIGKNLKLRIKS